MGREIAHAKIKKILSKPKLSINEFKQKIADDSELKLDELSVNQIFEYKSELTGFSVQQCEKIVEEISKMIKDKSIFKAQIEIR